MRKPCSGKPSIVICSSHSEPAKDKCFHSSHVKSALNVCKIGGTGSTFIEMIHILLSSWACIWLICLFWSHFPKLANSARQTSRSEIFFFLEYFLHQLCTFLMSWSVMSVWLKSVILLCTLSRWVINLLPRFIAEKNKECYYKSIIYEGLYWKVMHIWSYPTGSKGRNKEWLNNIEVVVGYLQRNYKYRILSKEWQTGIYYSVLQSCLVWGQGMLACSILFTVHYMT